MFTRTGNCDRCGECCGYPRSTDNGQNNPWPTDWPQSVQAWQIDVLGDNFPMYKFTGHPNLGGKASGTFKLGGNTIHWCWANGVGLATDIAPYNDGGATYDIRCPLLLAKRPDGSVPCAAYGVTQVVPGSTKTFHDLWALLCEPVPPLVFDDVEQVNNWYMNCPSCSYVYIEE